jgi:predicted dehydrogenase
MRKALPLLFLEGLIPESSFFFHNEDVFRQREFLGDSIPFLDLESLIGEPLSVDIKLLESGDEIGKLDHRGSHLFDNRTGGGMIQDLGFHAVAPLFLLKDYLGSIDKSFRDGNVRTARCREYSDLATRLHNLPGEYIAESCAQLDFLTSTNVPIKVTVGKYVPHREDQRRIRITGTKGSVSLDYHENILYVMDEKGERKNLLELTNSKHTRYLPVILTALNYLNKRNPFRQDYTSSLLDAQGFILNAVGKAKETGPYTHENGEPASAIFS